MIILGGLPKDSNAEDLTVSEYEVGYGKPPKHSRFRKGTCPNPRGRGSRRDLKVGKIVQKVMNCKTEYREGGRLKKATRIELVIRKLASSAMNGDVSSAATLLKLRSHAENHGDTGPTVIRIHNALPE